jgi:hypothetical protein
LYFKIGVDVLPELLELTIWIHFMSVYMISRVSLVAFLLIKYDNLSKLTRSFLLILRIFRICAIIFTCRFFLDIAFFTSALRNYIYTIPVPVVSFLWNAAGSHYFSISIVLSILIINTVLFCLTHEKIVCYLISSYCLVISHFLSLLFLLKLIEAH